MATMKSVWTAAPGTVTVVDVPRPVPGPRDALVRVRACGICGTDTGYVALGGSPVTGELTSIPLGHEPAGEIAWVGTEVTGLRVGDRVVVNPMYPPGDVMGNGGRQGGMSEYLLIADAQVGRGVAVLPDEVPFEVAALNEPMAVALHGVNRSGARPGDKVVVFGAGPIGLGATIWLKLRGVEHVVVADVRPERLRRALAVGADAVVDSSRQDVTARLTELHGAAANALGAPRPGTDIYLDAAGAPAVIDTTMAAAKWGATLVMIAVHKKPVDISAMLRSELTLIASMGYPTEIFEVTPQLARHWSTFAQLISHRVPIADAPRAFQLAATPGAADKVIVTLDDQS